jgi:hypothetical protein
MSIPAPPPKQQLRLKLRQSPGSDPNTPGARGSATPGIIVDGDSLQRQQRHVNDGLNGKSPRLPLQAKAGTPAASTNPFTGPRGISANIAPLPAAQTRAALSPAAPNGIKQDMHSPALNAVRPASITSDHRLSIPVHTPQPLMAPPHVPRPASGSPYPNGPIGQQTATNGHYQAPTYYVPPSALRTDTFRKVPLKSK